MRIFPYDPPKYSSEFLRRMRKHPKINQIPSARQLLTIPQLILARYFRKGTKLSEEDYIDISMATSFPTNQELAKEVAFQILFPNHTIQDLNLFLEGRSIEEIKINDDNNLLICQEERENELIQELFDEIKVSENLIKDDIRKIEDFYKLSLHNKDKEPFTSYLVFIENISDFFENNISSIDDLIKIIKKRINEKVNLLVPLELVAINNLSLNQLVENNSRKPWELFTIKALENNKDYGGVDSIISDIIGRKYRFSNVIKIIKYLKNTNILTIKQNRRLSDYISRNIHIIEDLYIASFEIQELPDFNMEEILINSIYITPLEQNLKLAKNLDQTFGTNIRRAFFRFLNKEFTISNPVLIDNIEDGLLELIGQYAIASKSWSQLFQNILEAKKTKAMNAFRAYEELKKLTYLIISLSHSNENIYCSHAISQFIPKLVKITFHSCIVPSELRDVIEFFKNLGLEYDKNDIKIVGLKVGMEEDEIFELIEDDYNILKLLMSKPQNDVKKIKDLIKKIKHQLDNENILELMKLALNSDNIAGLANLAAFNLEQSLEAAKKIQGKIGMEKLISSLTATDGESLIKQWFLYRDKIPNIFKEKIKDTAKKVLIDLGINYSRTYLGSFSSGILQTNLVRPYEMGDDLEDIDFETSILNLLENGKRINELSYNDLYVFITSSSSRSICIELDISESMTGEKLAYMAICITMLVYGLRKEELGIIFFEKDNYVLKEIDQKIELEDLADELLEVSSRGTTFVQKALYWARDQFKRAYKSTRKINLLFSDADIYDIPKASETLQAFKSLGVEFILICPAIEYDKKQSEKIIKLSGGQLITVKNWESFPEQLVNIINSRL